MAKGKKNAKKAKKVPKGQPAQQEAAGGSASTTVESMVPSETKVPVDSTPDESSTKMNQDVLHIEPSEKNAAIERISEMIETTPSETKVSVDSSIVEAPRESSPKKNQDGQVLQPSEKDDATDLSSVKTDSTTLETKVPVDSSIVEVPSEGSTGESESSTKQNPEVQVIQQSENDDASDLSSVKTDSTTPKTKVPVDSLSVEAPSESSTDKKEHVQDVCVEKKSDDVAECDDSSTIDEPDERSRAGDESSADTNSGDGSDNSTQELFTEIESVGRQRSSSSRDRDRRPPVNRYGYSDDRRDNRRHAAPYSDRRGQSSSGGGNDCNRQRFGKRSRSNSPHVHKNERNNKRDGLIEDFCRAPFNETFSGSFEIRDEEDGMIRPRNWNDVRLDHVLNRNVERLVSESRLTSLQRFLLPALITNRDVSWQVGSGSLMAYSVIIANKFAKENLTVRKSRWTGAKPMAIVMVTTSHHAELVAEHFEKLRVPDMQVTVSTGSRRAERTASNLEGCDILIGTFVHLNNLVGHRQVNVDQVRVMVIDQYAKPGPPHPSNDEDRTVREAIQNILEMSPRSSKWLITNKWMPTLDFWPTEFADVTQPPIKITPILKKTEHNYNNVHLKFFSHSTSEEKIHKLFDALECDASGHLERTLVFCSRRRWTSLVEKCGRRRYRAEVFTGYPVASDTEILLCADEFSPDTSKVAHVVCLSFPEGRAETLYNILKKRRGFLGKQRKVVLSIFYNRKDRELLSAIRAFANSMRLRVPNEIEEALDAKHFA